MIPEEEITAAGFEKEFKRELGKEKPTGRFILKGWTPLPYVDVSYPARAYGRYEKSGSHMAINTVQDLVNFKTKHIPIYSDPIN